MSVQKTSFHPCTSNVLGLLRKTERVASAVSKEIPPA